MRPLLTCFLNQALKLFLRCTWVRYSSTYFSIFEILSKNACPGHITWKQEGSRRPCFTAKTSQLTVNSIQYKAVNLYKIFKEIGFWPVGIDQEQIIRLHRFYRDILNLYLKDSNDISAFLKWAVLFFTQRSTHL